MRENRLYGSEGGVAFAPSLPLCAFERERALEGESPSLAVLPAKN